MSEIIIHAGTHKTGTTTIQDTLALNRRRLAESGIVFPQVGPNNGHHSLVTAWIDLPERYRDSQPAREAWRALATRYGPGTSTVIVSSEELSRGRPGVDMHELAGLVAPFGRRTVVCLLRGQLSYLQSVFLQVIRDVHIAPFEAYLNQCLVTNLAIGVMLDYGALYDRLLEGFRPDEIVFLSYEAAVRAPGGVVGSLLRRTCLGAAMPGLVPLPAGIPTSRPSPWPPGPPTRSPGRRWRAAGSSRWRARCSPRPSAPRRAPRSSPAPRRRGRWRISARSTPPSRHATARSTPDSRWRRRRCPRASFTAASSPSPSGSGSGSGCTGWRTPEGTRPLPCLCLPPPPLPAT